MSYAGHLTDLATVRQLMAERPVRAAAQPVDGGSTPPASHLTTEQMGGRTSLTLRVRRANRHDPGELAYIRSTFAEGYKQSSNRLDKLTWPDFKRLERPRLDAVLARTDTQLLVADLEGAVAGWLAWSPGRRVDTVHWTHTRHQLRKHGVMRALIDAAGLKPRIVYTHRGAKRSDVWIVPWLAERGINAAFVPMKEWL